MYKAPPICFDKVKEIFMPIFRKLYKRESRASIVIEADSYEEAGKTFDNWLKDSDNCEGLNEILSEREKDEEVWLTPFKNWEEYNRSSYACDDIHIDKKPTEPLFDLIIRYPTMDNYEEKWEGIPMSLLLHNLGKMNTSYILEPEYYTTGGSLVNMVARRDAGISAIMVFKATRREDK